MLDKYKTPNVMQYLECEKVNRVQKHTMLYSDWIARWWRMYRNWIII